MSTLTAEELGKQLEKQTKAITEYVDRRFEAVDRRFDEVEKRTDVKLAALETRFEARLDERFDDLGRMIATGFHDLEGRLDVREQVKKHDHRIGRIEHALNIKA